MKESRAQRVHHPRGYKYRERASILNLLLSHPFCWTPGSQDLRHHERFEDNHFNLCRPTHPFTAGLIYLAVVERTQEGRRFISEDRKEGDVYDTLHLETRSRNTEKLSVDQAATVLLNFLQQAREAADENRDEVYIQELPVWKREYF
ncbi:hypothetical protein FQN60_005975 [Etheostoma spectabile]|uniref:Uncharacterized protein n=1 Tax=Etheostoma spectabile TaxID=54343 RepID=A0A5J5CJK9_9PERO|nr:hypothetical protein FQN60_005975 [Etheostoma spectabile]